MCYIHTLFVLHQNIGVNIILEKKKKKRKEKEKKTNLCFQGNNKKHPKIQSQTKRKWRKKKLQDNGIHLQPIISQRPRPFLRVMAPRKWLPRNHWPAYLYCHHHLYNHNHRRKLNHKRLLHLTLLSHMHPPLSLHHQPLLQAHQWRPCCPNASLDHYLYWVFWLLLLPLVCFSGSHEGPRECQALCQKLCYFVCALLCLLFVCSLSLSLFSMVCGSWVSFENCFWLY